MFIYQLTISNLDIDIRYLVIKMYGRRFDERKDENCNGMERENHMGGMEHRGMSSGKGRHGMHGFGLKYLILSMASTEEITGVNVMDRVDQRTGGRWVPSPGVIYPALRKLHEDGYLEMREEDNKKYYKATEKGKDIVKDTIFPWNQRKEEMNSVDAILEKMEDYTQYILDNSGKLDDKERERVKSIYKQLDAFK